MLVEFLICLNDCFDWYTLLCYPVFRIKMLKIICSPGGDGLTFYTLHNSCPIRPQNHPVGGNRYLMSGSNIELYKILNGFAWVKSKQSVVARGKVRAGSELKE